MHAVCKIYVTFSLFPNFNSHISKEFTSGGFKAGGHGFPFQMQKKAIFMEKEPDFRGKMGKRVVWPPFKVKFSKNSCLPLDQFLDPPLEFTNETKVTIEFSAKNTTRITYSAFGKILYCLLYTSPSPRDRTRSRMPSSA